MHYKLSKAGKILKEPNLLKWAKWFEHTPLRFVKKTIVGNYRVSTIFLGLDYGFDWDASKKPVLFETMVFENKLSVDKVGMKSFKYRKSLDDFTERYCTLKEAQEGHKLIVKQIRKI